MKIPRPGKNIGNQQQFSLKNEPTVEKHLSPFERLTLILTSAGIVASFVILTWQLHDSHKQMRLDQRAWIGLQGMTLKNLKAEQPIIAEADFTNSGKSPALAVTWDATFVPHVGELDVEKYAKSPERPHEKSKSRGVIVPDAVLFIPMEAKLPLINAPGVDEVKNGTARLYALGEIWYSDIFGDPHVTHFCEVFEPILGKFVFCDGYNSAN